MDTSLKLETLLEHAEWVRRLARSLVADPARAEDVAQETWLAALRSPPREATNLRGWLAAIVRNAARRAGRADERRDRRERSAAREESLPSASDLVQQADLQREIAALVIALDEPYRHTLLLRYYQGLGPIEIAARTGVPLNTVRTHLARGLEQLRERLDRRFDGRDAWCSVLAPLAAPALSGAVQGSTVLSLGTLIMAMKLQWAAAVGAACLGLWWLWPREETRVAESLASGSNLAAPSSVETPPSAPEPRTAEPGTSTPATAPDSGAEAPPRAVTVVRGRCVDLSGTPLVGVEFEWIDEREASVHDGVLSVGRDRVVLTDEVRAILADSTAAAALFPELTQGAHGIAEALRGERYRRPRVPTAADGTFAIEQVSAGGKLELVDAKLQLLDRVRVTEFPETLYVVAPCLEVGGTVRDRDGLPIRSARVEWAFRIQAARAFPYFVESVGNRMVWSTTDESGRFHIARLPVSPERTLRVTADGYLPSVVAAPVRDETRLIVVLEPSTAGSRPHIGGRVLLADGRPAAGARVDFGQDSARAGEDGTFRLELTTQVQEPTALSATRKGARPETLGRFGAVVLAGDSRIDGVVIMLGEELPPIRGRVVDANGVPCAGWSVALLDALPLGASNRTLEWVAGGEPDDPVTDAAGRFEFGGLCDRTYRIRAWSSETLVGVDSGPARAGDDGVELRVPEDALVDRVEGRVVSRGGEPLPNIEIVLGRNTVFAGEAISMVWRSQGKTDGRGRFLLRNVPRRGCRIGADDARIRSTTVELDEDSLGRELVIEVDLDLRFRVKARTPVEFDRLGVLDSQGRVLAFAVHLHRSESWTERVGSSADGFPICSTTEAARTLVLYRGETEVRRVPLALRPGEINVLSL